MSEKVLIIEDSGAILREHRDIIEFAVLPHPKTGNVVFLSLDNVYYELQNYEPRTHASWFIDQRVSSSSTMYLASRVDPRYLLLPFIMKAARYSPIEQIVTNSNGCDRFNLTNISKWKMNEFCDVNDSYEDEVYYRYNQVKLILWLVAKVLRCARMLYARRQSRLHQSTNKGFAQGFNMTTKVHSKSGTTNGDEVNSSVESTGVEVEYANEDVVLALQLVSDYIPDSVADLLVAHLSEAGLIVSASTASSDNNGTTNTAASAATANVLEETPLKRPASWEQDLELERETLSYMSAGVSSNTSNSHSHSNTPSDKKPKIEASNSSNKKTLVAPKGVKSLSNYFGVKK